MNVSSLQLSMFWNMSILQNLSWLQGVIFGKTTKDLAKCCTTSWQITNICKTGGAKMYIYISNVKCAFQADNMLLGTKQKKCSKNKVIQIWLQQNCCSHVKKLQRYSNTTCIMLMCTFLNSSGCLIKYTSNIDKCFADKSAEFMPQVASRIYTDNNIIKHMTTDPVRKEISNDQATKLPR